jgi:DNA-binding MarR family transcriptional regulator
VLTTTETEPARPVGRVAPATHARELARLAITERTHTECSPLHVQTVIWLFRAYNAVMSDLADELRPLDLSPSGFNVLMALNNTAGNTLEPCQLAERLLVSRPSVTGLLDTLEARGLVRREPHAEDRRRVNVVLTGRGAALLAGNFAEHYRRQRELFGDMTPDELTQLVTLLRKVRGATPPHLRTAAEPEC